MALNRTSGQTHITMLGDDHTPPLKVIHLKITVAIHINLFESPIPVLDLYIAWMGPHLFLLVPR